MITWNRENANKFNYLDLFASSIILHPQVLHQATTKINPMSARALLENMTVGSVLVSTNMSPDTLCSTHKNKEANLGCCKLEKEILKEAKNLEK